GHQRHRGQDRDGGGNDEPAVVHDADDGGGEQREQRLRQVDRDGRGRAGAPLQTGWGQALAQRDERHHGPGDPEADRGERDTHGHQARRDRGEEPDREDQDADAEGPDLAPAADDRGGGQAADHRADALHRDQRTERLGGQPETLLDDREDGHVDQPGRPEGDGDHERQPAQHRGGPEVAEPGGQLGPVAAPLLGCLRRGLLDLDRGQQTSGDQERNGGEYDDRVRPVDGIQGGADQGGDQPERLVDAGEQAVAGRQVLVRQEVADQSGLRGSGEVGDRGVEQHHRVDQPQPRGGGDQQQAADDRGHEEVGDLQEPLAGHAVRDLAQERREQRGQPEHGEGQAGSAVRAGELLDPDGEHQEE